MSLFGRGIAFNNSFFPRGPVRGPLPPVPMGRPKAPIFCGWSGCHISESFTYKTNFWDVLVAGITTFGQVSWMNGMGGLGTWNMGKSDITKESKENKSLSNLVDFYGSKYTIKSHPTKDGIYQAVPKDGGEMIEGTYDQLLEKFGKASKTKTDPSTQQKVEQTEAEKLAEEEAKKKADAEAKAKADAEAKAKAEEEEAKKKTNTETDHEIDSVSHQEDKNQKISSKNSKTGHSSGIKDWYRIDKDKNPQLKDKIKEGMSARQVLDIVLNNKVNYLSSEDRNKLVKELIQNNPSIFKDGRVKKGFDINKLDIPTVNYIKENYVASRNFKQTKGTGEYTGTNNKTHTITKTVTSKTGRYAKKEDGKWRYYAKDGTELVNSYITKDNDPELYYQTKINLDK